MTGLPPAREQHGLLVRRTVKRATTAAMVGLLALGLGLTGTDRARADGLDDQKKKVDAALAQSAEDLEHYNQEALQAAAALRQSQARLAEAQAALAQAESQLRSAKAEDARMAAELKAAQAALSKARAEAVKAAAEVAAFHEKIGARAREQMQQRGHLNGLAILVTDANTADLNQKAQWSTTIFDSSGRQMDRLRELKLSLDAAQTAATEAEAKVNTARQQAAAQLATSQELTNRASAARQQVASATAQLATAKSAADQQVASETERQAQLASEQAEVSKRIQERIARQKAEAARKAKEEAERKAREAAAAKAAAKAAADKAAQQKASRSSSRTTTTTTKTSPTKTTSTKTTTKRTTTTVSSSSLFSMPVSGPITSSYGMRLHPVLGYWKLHDGTDFGAACGAPIRAPRDGVVAERYYNGGYGNRLMLDHGLVNGSYVTTGYNHATHYVVSVGQSVKRGQIIGYVGSTGYSTGCHLHLMVWDDGNVVNPMNWF